MVLYYYTSTQTLQYILTNANMYATNMSYMNDSEEYVNGLTEIYYLMNDTNLLEQWNEKHKDEEKIDIGQVKSLCTEEDLNKFRSSCDSYSISFCVKQDLLSQWSMYAKECGVSITMDFENWEKLEYLGYSRNSGEPKKREAIMSWPVAPKPVYYFTRSANMKKEHREDTSEKILDTFFLNDTKSSNVNVYEYFEEQWKSIGTYVKRYDFYQEDEYRIVFNQKDLRIDPRIDYRNDKNVLKPYLDIECKDGWPVWEIMVGPGFNQAAVYKSLRHFLDHAAVYCQINTEGDYWKRVEEYMKKAPDIWKKDDAHNLAEVTNLRAEIVKNAASQNSGFDKNQKYSLVRETAEKIMEDRSGIASEADKEYFRENYFSVSGIVLKKSKIPYIF